jgi:hypothetical protein
MRQGDAKGATAGIKKMFDENPAELEAYLEAILAGEKDKLSAEAGKLKGKLSAVDKFRNDAALIALFDTLAEEQRALSTTLKKSLEADFDAAEKAMGVGTLRAPGSLVVVVNPLDAHDVVRRVSVGETSYLIVGPGLDAAQHAVLNQSLRLALAKPIKDAWPNAKKFKAHWDSLKASTRIGRFYREDEAYFAAALSSAMVYHVRSGRARNKDKDEDFIEQQSNEGQRWARAALKVLDDSAGQMSTELGKALAKASP